MGMFYSLLPWRHVGAHSYYSRLIVDPWITAEMNGQRKVSYVMEQWLLSMWPFVKRTNNRYLLYWLIIIASFCSGPALPPVPGLLDYKTR